ncbi:MAG: DNA polymerase III subunit delta [Thermodesulfovibrionia bacterium]|nr:DNA polymerase III subunit delta [Thermodesulfovibrionia bacterium]
MLNNKFNKELQKHLPAPLYFLYSKESILLDRVLSESLRVVIDPHQKDFNYDVFYASASPQEIFDTACTMPFLAARRLVVLKDFHQFSAAHTAALMAYLKKPCDSTCMLILSLKEPKMDKDIKCPTYLFRIREHDMPVWIKQLATTKDIKISGSAVEYLIQTLGPDLGLLAMEVEKLALSGLKKIEIKDVIPSIATTREYIPFNLLDALVAGQKAKAFKILKKLVEGKPSDAPAVLGALNWHYMQLYSLWVNKGKKPHKMRESTFKSLLKYLPHFNQGSFYRIFHSFHEADIEIKTLSRADLTLEILLLKLLQIGARN